MSEIKRTIQTLPVSLAIVGRIKIGGKGEARTSRSGGTYQLPERWDHIVITTNERGPDNNFLPHRGVMAALSPNGQPVKRVRCILLFNGEEFRSGYRLYDGKTLVCYGDGINAMENGVSRACRCGRQVFGYSGADQCKATATLDVMLEKQTMIGGLFRLATTSINTISSIQGTLSFLARLTDGRFSGIPLALTIQPKTVQLPNGGQSTVYFLALEVEGTIMSIIENARRMAVEMRNAKQSLLTASDELVIENDEDDLMEAEDVEEFFPPGQQRTAIPPPVSTPAGPARISPASLLQKQEAKKELPAQAAPQPTQEASESIFKPGKEITVTLKSGAVEKGLLIACTPETFVLECDDKNGTFTIQRIDVAEAIAR